MSASGGVPGSVVADSVHGMCVGGSREQEREGHRASAPKMKKVGLCAGAWAERGRGRSPSPRPSEDIGTAVLGLRAKEFASNQGEEPGKCPNILTKSQRGAPENGRAGPHRRQASP